MVCPGCGVDHPPNNFHKGAAKCKPCRRVQNREWRLANLERERARDRKRSRLPHRKAAVKARYKASVATVAGADRHRAYRVAHNIKHAHKLQARKDVREALKAGRLTRQPCVKCGAGRAHAHHEDYSQPLVVVWLCKRHHGQRHRQINKERRKL